MHITIYCISVQIGKAEHDIKNHAIGFYQTAEHLELTQRAPGAWSNPSFIWK